jgi:hypothetical protein
MANLANAGFRQLSGLGFAEPYSDDWWGDIFGAPTTGSGGGSSSGGGTSGGGSSGAAIGIINAVGGAVANVTRGVTGNYPTQQQGIVPARIVGGVQYDAAGNVISPRAVGNFAEDLSHTIQNNLGLIVIGGIFLFAWKREPARRNPTPRARRNGKARNPRPRTINVKPLSVK